MDNTNQHEPSKVIRLVEFLSRFASLRTKMVRDVSDYGTSNVFWVNNVPKQKGCFARAWGCDEEVDSDIWIEVRKQPEPELPNVPPVCKDWIDYSTLRNKSDIPALHSEITVQTKNSAWHADSNEPEVISRIECLDDHPDTQPAWNQYIENHWRPWVDKHNDWQQVQDVYTSLFAIHQEQLRLGEEYELVFGVGLLTWKSPNGQRVRRHLIVANALLEFEASLGTFTVSPLPSDGAKVRAELDMLGVDEQPRGAEQTATSKLAEAADDLWDTETVDGVLRALAHSMLGDYNNDLEGTTARASEKPVVDFAPALILRKRSARGLTETLKRIKRGIEDGGTIPNGFGTVAEQSQPNREPQIDPREQRCDPAGEVFFPKPSNEAQREIVEKLKSANGVLVQGPPGTGKSHTIANLVCHLLATGQRILVTAKTPRALQVLEGLLPEEVRPLCINLLGSGNEEKRSLESSVNGILRKNDEWNENLAKASCEELERRLLELREEKAKTERRLRAIRESETNSQSIADGRYRGTAARIAEPVNADRTKYEWFTDSVPLNMACPITADELRKVIKGLRHFPAEKRSELNLVCPPDLHSHEQFSTLVKRESRAIEQEKLSSHGADRQIAENLSMIDAKKIRLIHDALVAFRNQCKRLAVLTDPWMPDALRDIRNANTLIWHELRKVTRNVIESIESIVDTVDKTSVALPNEMDMASLYDDACKIIEHLESGGQRGWGPFRPKLVKRHGKAIKTTRLNGRRCTIDAENLALLANVLKVKIECARGWTFWQAHCNKHEGPFALQLQAFKSLFHALDNALSLVDLIKNCCFAIRQCPNLNEPVWSDEAQIEQLIASCALSFARHEKRMCVEAIASHEAVIRSIAAGNNSHPITRQALDAIRNRDVEQFANIHRAIQALNRDRAHLQKLTDYVTKRRELVPELIRDLEQTCGLEVWNDQIPQIQDAWRWSQAKVWVEEYVKKEDTPGLNQRARQIEDEINATITELAALNAWSFCFSRLEDKHRRHMEAWQQSMRRLGKGTGKHAPRHRRQAQHHLRECREAVPAWVMPLHRVWDTIDPAPEMFDVVIVDEASQCGIEALPLTYLGKTVLVVGDDKQISPDAVGLSRDAVHRLMEEYLYDFDFKSSFDVESSLFDHGRRLYGTHRITLREHFRCMPEIIRFSNELCYSGTPLIPLRQFGPDRLPPLEHIFVEGGHREGSGSRVVNRPEADAIVNKIVELCADERYDGKTMGVVVLQAEAQAGYIERELLDRLGADEMVNQRRLVCGNPYSFQGDERDIMFLSMVAAPNQRIGALVKAADERRFNVAASRAKDQMILFHSATCDDLSSACLRRRLLEFFEETRSHEIADINKDELERRAFQDNRTIVKPPVPFDSWFEVDVALEISRKGFEVCPQFEVAGKRIDLVVFQGSGQFAVECDGDWCHGADRFEDDQQRQRQLERCGWEFFRVRESVFYANKELALQRLWQMLDERETLSSPLSELDDFERSADEPDSDEVDSDHFQVESIAHTVECDEASERREGASRQLRIFSPSDDSEGDEDTQLTPQVENVQTSEIADAILDGLAGCSNQSCMVDSITKLVLEQLEIPARSRPRGNRRNKFEERVKRTLNTLSKENRIEKYKVKNWRVRLLKKAA